MIEFILTRDQEESIRMHINSIINDAVEKNTSVKYLGREYLRIGEASDYLGITPVTLNKFIRMGLAVSIIDGTKLVSKSSIKKFVETFEQ